MTPIEHLLIDIIKIFFRDRIDKTTAHIRRQIAATDVFQPTLRNFFFKRRPMIFLYGRASSFVWCCLENLRCRSARVFRASWTEIVFRPTPACLIYSGRKTLAHLGKKMWFTDTDRKQCKPASARRDDRSRFRKEVSPDDADRTFPNKHHPNIVQGLKRKHNGRHRSL